MSVLGVGAGEFVTIPTLCWKIYRACKDAPEEYQNLSTEVGSLELLLRESKELAERDSARWTESQVERLLGIHKACEVVLNEMEEIIEYYKSLGSKSKRTWDRMKWGLDKVDGIRVRLTSNTTLLSAFITSITA